MMINLLDGLIYVLGLVLLVMPAESVPYFDGEDQNVRIGKHLLGLLLFAGGTVRIHRTIQADAGSGFILASAVLILIIAVFKAWKANQGRDPEDESS